MKKLIMIVVTLFCVPLVGCGQPADIQTGSANTDISGSISSDTASISSSFMQEQTATLYIGTKSSGFQEYPLTYTGDLTPELLIQGIADLTGWNLALAKEVTSGKGGMSVCLSNGSSLFVGPPDPQKDEFHMYDAMQFSETILDSIQKTLQMGFTGEGGDPDALDIYYYMEGEQPLTLPDLDLSWPLDQPYQWPVVQ